MTRVLFLVLVAGAWLADLRFDRTATPLFAVLYALAIFVQRWIMGGRQFDADRLAEKEAERLRDLRSLYFCGGSLQPELEPGEKIALMEILDPRRALLRKLAVWALMGAWIYSVYRFGVPFHWPDLLLIGGALVITQSATSGHQLMALGLNALAAAYCLSTLDRNPIVPALFYGALLLVAVVTHQRVETAARVGLDPRNWIHERRYAIVRTAGSALGLLAALALVVHGLLPKELNLPSLALPQSMEERFVRAGVKAGQAIGRQLQKDAPPAPAGGSGGSSARGASGGGTGAGGAGAAPNPDPQSVAQAIELMKHVRIPMGSAAHVAKEPAADGAAGGGSGEMRFPPGSVTPEDLERSIERLQRARDVSPADSEAALAEARRILRELPEEEKRAIRESMSREPLALDARQARDLEQALQQVPEKDLSPETRAALEQARANVLRELKRQEAPAGGGTTATVPAAAPATLPAAPIELIDRDRQAIAQALRQVPTESARLVPALQQKIEAPGAPRAPAPGADVTDAGTSSNPPSAPVVPVASAAPSPPPPVLSEAALHALFRAGKLIVMIAAILLLVTFLQRLLARKKPEELEEDPARLDAEERRELKERFRALEKSDLAPEEEVIRRYHHFLDLTRKLGRARPDSLPATEYGQELARGYPSIGKPIRQLTGVFCDVYYGETRVPAKTLADVRLYHRAICKRLWV